MTIFATEAPTTGLGPDPRDEFRVTNGYFDVAVDEPGTVIERARIDLANVDFDTFVATGLSGASVATLLAHALGKNYLLIRKPDDMSTHDSNRAVGILGKRWLFLDDFVSSGRTRRRVHEQLRDMLQDRPLCDYDATTRTWAYHEPFATEYVGDYHYARNDGQFVPASDINIEDYFPR